MYSFYAMKYYYKRGDAQCDLANKAIDKLTKDGTLGHIAGFTRMSVYDRPPSEQDINITKVPAFVYHGELVYQAKGTETEEDWESIIKNLMQMADPKVVGAH